MENKFLVFDKRINRRVYLRNLRKPPAARAYRRAPSCCVWFVWQNADSKNRTVFAIT